MSKVFISYRRDDSAFAAYAVYDRLAERLGADDIFIDMDDIPLGVDFWEFITARLESCDVLLVFVGQHWLGDCARAGAPSAERRLDDPEDYVRREIAHCLKRDITIVPVLCGDAARMPDEEELPEELKKFARRNGLELRPGRGVFSQIDGLAKNLQEMLLVKEKAEEEAKKQAPAKPGEQPPPPLPAARYERYRAAYISYAAEDRAEVLKRVALMEVVKVTPILDIMFLKPGSRWEDAWREHLKSADVLFLFWSSHAAKSRRVAKEVEFALSLNKEIVPVILESPPPPPPPGLRHLRFYFNDVTEYFRSAQADAGGKAGPT